MSTKERIKDSKEGLENWGKEIVEQLKKIQNPDMTLPVRNLSNIYFDDKSKLIMLGEKVSHRTYLNAAHTRKFMQTAMVAAGCKKLIEQEVTTSIRDLFYNMKHTIPKFNEETFETQEESDPLIEDIEASLNTLRENLHLHAEQKGSLVGPIKIKEPNFGVENDCTKLGASGYGIPSICEPDTVQFQECKAEFVLIVEKDAIWQRLNEDRFWKKHNCLVITGKGQPDRGTRRMINRLHNELKLPILVCADADVWGFYIYSVIKQGSINLSFVSDRLGTPEAKYLGLTTQDVLKYNIPKNVTIKLNEGDKKRAQELLNYVWFKKKEWEHEIKHMLQVGYKLELEALSSKDIRFITEKYLPQKIKEEDYLP